MATLLLRLVAPMQSWGSRSRFDDRDSEAEPTRSGVLGLCAAALGIDRAEPIDYLTTLRFGVRVDREGGVGRDYHTAQLYPNNPKTKTDVTTRYYLSDAAFWAGLEGDMATLERLHAALQNPHWPLSLGRKAFQASLPVFTAEGPRDLSLWNALREVPSLRRQEDEGPYRLVLDRAAVPESLRIGAAPSRRQDVPAGPFIYRRYLSREVLTLTQTLDLPTDPLLLSHPHRQQEEAI